MKSIILASDEVAATRGGLKTIMRRPVMVNWGRRRKRPDEPYEYDHDGVLMTTDEYGDGHPFVDHYPCPYGVVGETRWVREDFYESGYHYRSYPEDEEYLGWAGTGVFRYVADGIPECRGPHEWGPCRDNALRASQGKNFFPDRGRYYWRRRVSIQMPRRASRMSLTIVETRIERVQRITEAGAEAEGVNCCYLGRSNHYLQSPTSFVYGFRNWWDARYPGSWDRNDFVWVITYKWQELKV